MVRLIARDLMIDRPAAPSRVLALFRNDTSVVHTPFHRRTKTVGRISTRIVLRERKKKKKKSYHHACLLFAKTTTASRAEAGGRFELGRLALVTGVLNT